MGYESFMTKAGRLGNKVAQEHCAIRIREKKKPLKDHVG